MTADESRAVIDLWQQERVEQTGLTDRPAVLDVAEGLDISVEDVQRLLREVRARREALDMLAQEQALSEARLAEGQRQLAEIQCQQAVIQRQRAEEEKRMAEQQVWQSLVRWRNSEDPSELLLGFLPGFVAIAFVVGMALLLTALVHPMPQVR